MINQQKKNILLLCLYHFSTAQKNITAQPGKTKKECGRGPEKKKGRAGRAGTPHKLAAEKQ